MRIEAAIQNETRKLGFAATGFAAVGPSRSFQRFQDWIAGGFAGEMTYLSKNTALRSDPRKVAPEAHSVIVVAARYLSFKGAGLSANASLCETNQGHSATYLSHFSNYVRGQDYHDVIRAKLKTLEKFIAQRVSTPLTARICVDSAPVLERECAARAGVGWIGKQGNIIHPEFGSCLFLGELFVNIDLEPSLPLKNECDDCRLCIDACPTGAILPDGLLDARHCISYLTVEYKGTIPCKLWPLMGSSLFGCDRCTAVCPWNRYGAEMVMPEFGESNRALPSPEECLTMGEKDFIGCFSGSAVFRTGLERLQRNAVIVLANERRKSCVPLLEMTLESPFPLVRTHAARALNLNYS